MMKNKLIEKLNTLYSEFESLSKDLEKFTVSKDISKADQFDWGSKVLKFREVSSKLLAYMELYLEEYDILDLSSMLQEFSKQVEAVKSELKTPTSEETKKFIDEINKAKNN